MVFLQCVYLRRKLQKKAFDAHDKNRTLDQSNKKLSPGILFNALQVMQQKSIAVLSSLSAAELSNPLEPTPTPQPIATTKFEAIDWNIKHTMYHCGQIGILSRIVEKRFDFGLRLGQE